MKSPQSGLRAGVNARASVTAALSLAAAGLLWLALSSRLTAAGARIDRLHAQRSELLERRANGLLAYADATDPRVLEQRAEALGLGPGEPSAYVIVSTSGARPMTSNGALAIMLAKRAELSRGETGRSDAYTLRALGAGSEAGR